MKPPPAPPLIEDGFELPSETAFDLIESVYRSTDNFAADFEAEHPSPAALSDHLEEIGKRPGRLFLVARAEDELLGFLFVLPRRAARLRHTADLNMGVVAAARGRGIGSELLKAALARLEREQVIEILYLMVRADNDPALRLYTAHGFETLATLARDTRIGSCYCDGVLLRKLIQVSL